ncbi:MAG: hypothetical protein IOB84_02290 [Brevundimonas sp.]|jgi:hypothetical protein|nr:hypothetical protein [Brevundimonas sp.]
MAERNDKGQFEKGHTGNPLGRGARRQRRHRLPVSNRLTAFEVAEMPIEMKGRDGENEVTTYYRGVLIAMARKGMAGHAPSQRAFLEQVDRAAAAYGDSHALIQFLFRETARLETLVDQYEAKAVTRRTGVLEVSQEEWDRRTAELNERWEKRKQIGFT